MSLAVTGCGGSSKSSSAGSSTGGSKTPLSKTTFCSRAVTFGESINTAGSDTTVNQAKRDWPKVLTDAKALRPAPSGVGTPVNDMISDLQQVINWLDTKGTNQALNGKSVPSAIKKPFDNMQSSAKQMASWEKQNCEGTPAAGSGSGAGASGGSSGSGKQSSGGGAGNS